MQRGVASDCRGHDILDRAVGAWGSDTEELALVNVIDESFVEVGVSVDGRCCTEQGKGQNGFD